MSRNLHAPRASVKGTRQDFTKPPVLPFVTRDDLLEELAEIRRERDAIVGDIDPVRAQQQRELLDWWERELTEQLQEMDA